MDIRTASVVAFIVAQALTLSAARFAPKWQRITAWAVSLVAAIALSFTL